MEAVQLLQEDMRGVGVRREGCITFRNSVGWYWLIYFTPEIGCFTKQTCKEVPLFGERIIHEAESCVQTHSLQIHVCRASKQTLPGRSFHQQHEASLWQRTASRTMPPSARVLMAGIGSRFSSSWRRCAKAPCRRMALAMPQPSLAWITGNWHWLCLSKCSASPSREIMCHTTRP